MSLHLVVEERGLTEKHRFTARLIFLLGKIGLHLPDMLIAENAAYEAYIRQKYDLPAERFQHIPHGADDRLFFPRSSRLPGDCFRVTYHGTFLPSHGLETIICAAGLLCNYVDIVFNFYGDGPERPRIEQLARQQELKNVHFHGFVSQAELIDSISRSHVCQGVFGSTRQSNFTI
jgi:glycosyltransferase involved in cell wall biosynthesis